jgi:hypothetical protein
MRLASSGTMCSPVLHGFGEAGGEEFFPNATIPPVRVTLLMRLSTNLR